MPALAGLLIVVGWRAIKPSRIWSVVKSGPLPTAIMAVTFGLSLVEVLRRFAQELREAGSSLKVVATGEHVLAQLDAGGLVDEIGARNVYRSTEWVGETLRRAHADAQGEVAG